MASRVNTKFVVQLSVVLVLAFAGVGASAFFLLRNSGDDLARAGDKKMLAGDYKMASELYSKAVNKEKTNVAFLEKWRDALKGLVPETQVKYSDAYAKYLMALRQLAIVRPDAVEDQATYLELRQASLGPVVYDRGGYDFVLREADTLLALHTTDADPAMGDRLRRYRGLVRLRLAAESPDAKPELIQGAKEDLEAALRANPADTETAVALENWYELQAAKARSETRHDEADAFVKAGGEVVQAFLDRNPSSAMMMLVSLRRDLQAATREFAKNGDRKDAAAVSKEFQARTLPLLERAAQAALANPSIDLMVIGMMRQMETSVDPVAKLRRTESLVAAALKARPDDADLMAARADLLATSEDFAGAIAQAEAVIALPIKPLSLAGARLFGQKNDALFQQAMWTVRTWQAAAPEAKAGPAERVKQLRDKLAAVEAADSQRMMLVDAHLANIAGDLNTANRLLDQYNRLTMNSNPDALLVTAQVAAQLNQLGVARQRLQDLLRIQPSNLGALFFLADLETQLQNYADAERMFRAILEVSPGNEAVLQRLNRIAELQGQGSTDPVIQVLLAADKTATENKPDAANKVLAILTEGLAKQDDVRLILAVSFAHMRLNDRAAALEVVQRGLERHADSRELKNREIALSTEDQTEVLLRLIDAQDNLDAGRKAMMKYDALRNAGRRAEAKTQLAEALRVSPNDPAVIEAQFMDALEDSNFTLAGELTDRATTEDMDHAGGLTFRARLLAAQGNVKESIQLMDQVVKRGGAQPEAWRLLGKLYVMVSRQADAVTSYQEALKIRPTDIATINDLIATLANLGRHEEALAAARQHERYASGNSEFMDMWLTLETNLGNAVLARERREKLAKVEPKNRANLLALIAIYINSQEWAKARPLIDQARADQDGLDLISLDASWSWIQRDQVKARSIFEEYIAKQPTPATRPFMVFAEFLVQNQDVDGALAQLERARPYQSATVMEADKAIADMLFGLQRFTEVEPVCRRLIAANADTPDGQFRKRLAEALIGLKRFQEAEQELAALDNDGNPDVVTMMLMAECRAGLKDVRSQRDILERAVAKFPNDPIVFLKRGQAMMADEASIRDAIADFNKAVQLAPQMWQAYRLRAAAHAALNEIDEAIADLRLALRVNPGDDELLNRLVVDLLQRGREQEAVEVADEAVKRRPGDVMVVYRVAQIFAGIPRYQLAAQFFKTAFMLDQQDGISQRYLDCLLGSEPPDLIETQRVLDVLGARVPKNPGFQMAAAKLRMKQGRTAEASRTAIDSLRLLNPEDPRVMMAWFNDSKKLIEDPVKRAEFMELTSKSPGVSTDWIVFFKAVLAVSDPAKRDQGMVALKELLAATPNVGLKKLVYRTLSEAYYTVERFAEAAQVWQSQLNEFPDDPETANNLAFVLAKKLDRASEALPLAEKAVQGSPTRFESHDTLGVVYLANGRNADAVQSLKKAMELVTTSQGLVTVCTHLAEAHNALGEVSEARKCLDRADTEVKADPTAFSEQLKTDLVEARRKIGP